MRPPNAAMLVVGVLLAVGGAVALGEPVAQAANAQAQGRKHARKANHLADINKCKLAIPEYSKALRMLNDPTLLFNRADCYRRVGDAPRALADYRKFLAAMPAAPNRELVESQIAELDRSVAPVSAHALARSSGARPPEVEAPELPSRDPAELAEPESFARAEPPSLPRAAPVEREALAQPDAPALVDTAARPAARDRQQPAATLGSDPTSSRWWVWVVGAAVIAGGAAGTYFALKQGQTDIPSSALGNHKF
jgi:tetratricopeptide (TPR) repeat protein